MKSTSRVDHEASGIGRRALPYTREIIAAHMSCTNASESVQHGIFCCTHVAYEWNLNACSSKLAANTAIRTASLPEGQNNEHACIDTALLTLTRTKPTVNPSCQIRLSTRPSSTMAWEGC